MCTVTFWPHPRGYRLAMNRDEQRSRPAGLPPRLHPTRTGTAVHPSEPGGGTWISLNDHGVTFALLNGYSPSTPRVAATRPRVSRGEVVRQLRHVIDSSELPEILARLPLSQMPSFRLIAVLSAERRLIEWAWDGRDFQPRLHAWRPGQWISSGFDEPRARQARSQVFQQRSRDPFAGSLDWLRALHRSHEPAPGPFSTCMHRPDAITVSYTEIEVDPEVVRLAHLPHAPCQSAPPGAGASVPWIGDAAGEALERTPVLLEMDKGGARSTRSCGWTESPAPGGPDRSGLNLAEHVLDRL